jgi:hypothetical protein
MNTQTNNQVETVNKLTLEFYQTDGLTVTTKFTLNNDAKQSLVIGTAINELFTMQMNYRKAGLKLFKSNKPVLFKISNDKEEELLNIGKCQKYIQDTLKFNKTAKSMSSFAKRVNCAVIEMQRAVKIVDYSEIENAILSITE